MWTPLSRLPTSWAPSWHPAWAPARNALSGDPPTRTVSAEMLGIFSPQQGVRPPCALSHSSPPVAAILASGSVFASLDTSPGIIQGSEACFALPNPMLLCRCDKGGDPVERNHPSVRIDRYGRLLEYWSSGCDVAYDLQVAEASRSQSTAAASWASRAAPSSEVNNATASKKIEGAADRA
jgi:hypothetical protein